MHYEAYIIIIVVVVVSFKSVGYRLCKEKYTDRALSAQRNYVGVAWKLNFLCN